MSQQKGYRLLEEDPLPFTRPFLFASQSPKLGFASVLPPALSICPSFSPSPPDKAVLNLSTPPKTSLPHGPARREQTSPVALWGRIPPFFSFGVGGRGEKNKGGKDLQNVVGPGLEERT